MADYNYTYLNMCFDLNDVKQKSYFEIIQKQNKNDVSAEFLEKETAEVEVIGIEYMDICFAEETNTGTVSISISVKYETPKKAICFLHNKYGCKITGTSTTYDSDYTLIKTDEENNLTFDEYTDTEAHIVRSMVDIDYEYFVDIKDFSKYLISYKNKKLINKEDSFFQTISKINEDGFCTLLSIAVNERKFYYIYFGDCLSLTNEFLSKHNISIEGVLILDNSLNFDLDGYLEDSSIYLPVAFITEQNGAEKEKWMSYILK